MKTRTFELQGHRGARGLKPENTLPSFETALDAGVTSIETDVHLTHDGVPVLLHDPRMNDRFWRLRHTRDPLTSPDLATEPLVSNLTLDQLRGCLTRRHPDQQRFPDQVRFVTPLARRFVMPYAVCTLVDLFQPRRARTPSSASGPGASSSTWN
jgi:glycerophosphoryl diester phosphodiesterase